MKRCLLLSVLLALVAAATPAFAIGIIIVEDSSWWPGPPPPVPPHPWPHPIPRPHICTPLEVSFVKVNTRIHDQVAVTAVDQEFYNPNPARLEGTFVFPIPKGAHIDKFTMEIDGKQVEAELLTAEKARHIYEDIVRKLRDPALMEYAGRDVFKVRIFPIEPNSKKRVSIAYTQLLKADDGLVSYSLPLNTEKFSAKPIRNVSVKVDLETKRPLKSIYSPSHAVEVKRDGANRATAGYEASEVAPEADFTLYFAPEKDEIGLNLLTHKTGDGDGYFLLLASPGMETKARQVLPKDVVFVLDTSGSMAGKKLEQAKKALQFCVENLNDNDRFEVLRFSTEVEPLFAKLVEATAKNRSRAEEFVKDLRPMGGTAIDDALKKALREKKGEDGEKRMENGGGRPFVVVFLTDGCPTIGTTDEDQIVEHAKQESQGHTRVFCFGIGMDVNTHLLDRITEQTHAFSQYVLPEEDLEVKVSSFFSKIKEPVLANPTLQFTGDIRTTKLYPSPLPDLFKGEQLVLVGRYSGHGASAAVIEGTVNGETKRFTYDTQFRDENSENEFIPRLWATRRVGYLLDEIRLHGENAELRDEVTELARKYGIVTPYTAYLIVEDESRRQVPERLRLFKDLDRDNGARREAQANWQSFKDDRSGMSALAGARSSMALKGAAAPATAADTAVAEAHRALGYAGPSSTLAQDSSKAKLVQYSQQTQFVAGKNFFLNDKQWIDAAVQKHPDARHVRIQFGSAEYFNLAAKEPRTLSWLALGQNVQFELQGTVYEIYE
jgi:Ca-activated chloride channel homolog